MGHLAPPTEQEPPAPGTARARILQAAADSFLRKGIRATGVDNLIQDAQVAKSTFYRLFRSKDQLMVVWLRSPHARWLDVVRAKRDERDTSPLCTLLEYWGWLGGWIAATGYRGCPYLNTLAELDDPRHSARQEAVAFIDEVGGFLADTAAAAGFERAEELGDRLRLLTMGALMATLHERSLAPMDRAKDMAVEVLEGWPGLSGAELRAGVSGCADA